MHISDKLLITWTQMLLVNDSLIYILKVFNVTSICSATLVLSLFFLCCLLKPTVANRVSLRLQVGISFCDLLFHLLLTQYKTSVDGEFCAFVGFAHVALRQWYCFLFIAIGVNLQLIFIHDLNPKPRWEVIYWVLPIILTLAMNIPPLVLGEFGLNKEHDFLLFQG
ncbi:hypothetical protein DSO57_1018431 [Entomophthora muscae]|uniref:Uncharacterized protein n=1 Tax=Entomophthora muscae TaxID=34485 RepID=A0ACC2UE54_9FUNG|nr:hypothetical protein DSO57_1018431 [Entomophthora muscae]